MIEQPLTAREILTFQDKYKSKSGKGMDNLTRIFPADISEELASEIRDYAIRAYKAFEMGGIVRIDFLYKDRLYLNEINSIPGSMAYYLWKNKSLLRNMMACFGNPFTLFAEMKRRFLD